MKMRSALLPWFALTGCLLLSPANPVLGGESQKGRPTLFLIGDSTVNNGTAGQMGWGQVLARWFDTNQLAVVNRARGGRSSRTFFTEGLWDQVVAHLKPGDFVLMQFGHNDNGPLDTEKARASIKGTGDESRVITNQVTGKVEAVHTYGWYLRRYVTDAQAKGATPIVLSLVPRNIWKQSKVLRATGDFTKWAGAAAGAEGVAFVDLNAIIADRYDALGEEKVRAFFPTDHTHTNPDGAALNADCVAQGLRGLEGCPLRSFLLAPDRTPKVPSPTGP